MDSTTPSVGQSETPVLDKAPLNLIADLQSKSSLFTFLDARGQSIVRNGESGLLARLLWTHLISDFHTRYCFIDSQSITSDCCTLQVLEPHALSEGVSDELAN